MGKRLERERNGNGDRKVVTHYRRGEKNVGGSQGERRDRKEDKKILQGFRKMERSGRGKRRAWARSGELSVCLSAPSLPVCLPVHLPFWVSTGD